MGIVDNSKVKVEIDGIEFSAKRGTKIIEVADEAGIYIPRFCYHKKLSIAANCRMCLVEVEKAPKLFAACATPIADGMKIFTNTEKVISAQRAVMEFLLINHPLDCPICDQGGECELQDLTVGYGCTTSRFLESKRAFEDYSFGPLVSTDVTRCILCSRCVRFCSEISGTDDLGIINRGSNSRIFTFLKTNLRSGLSGNVVDLCPVGALTAKPSKFKARPWELVQKPFISSHDCLGSNLYLHVFRDKIIRVVPRRNDLINETWISDRDRFSYEGLYSSDRVKSPMLKKDGNWIDISWSQALDIVSKNIKSVIESSGADNIAAIASYNSTCEEFYILQKLLRALGSNNLDHRINQLDFNYQENMPVFSGIDIGMDEFDKLDSVLIIGSDIIKDHPVIGIKLRKIINNGGNVFVVNPIDFDFFMNVSNKIISNPKDFIHIISSLIKNFTFFNKDFNDKNIINLFSKLNGYEKYREFSEKFFSAKRKVILIGSYVIFSQDYSKILYLCNLLSSISGAYFGVLTDGANSSGAWLSGFVPHRLPGGVKHDIGNNVNCSNIFSKLLKLYILFGIELENDSIYAKKSLDALSKADFVVSFSSFKSDVLLGVADVILPIASTYENVGTYVNMSGIWQSFDPVVLSDYEVKFGWKALSDLASMLKLNGFNYIDSVHILSEIKSFINENCTLSWNFNVIDNLVSNINGDLIVIPYLSQYNVDSLVRRANSLQKIDRDNDFESNLVLKCNDGVYNKLILNKSLNKLLADKKIIVSIDNSVSDGVLFIRNYNLLNYIDYYLLYEVFSFDKI
ncbi:NADH-quinone oxidoreductase subunit NuoG [Candidatus Azoamicus ciliaticola]|uniref:NADH-quinone oxidoreductase n=1 Tax=Candidatus Azoamicus ciliaticola TaxID=2652803 RepID=A0A6J5JW37_9GAMM|nr:NADH-quinone oxidoreductase subunit NuoG [Candidatus Azoamicus ciliaticola]CAB3976528.1 NADH-quinone oxidoreductase chain 3 [Candidatus Azoamicus ciliaticola]